MTTNDSHGNAKPQSGSWILVRHAERVDSGDPDPPLTDAGKARARTLAAMLAEAGITAIYVSDLRRTLETAAPLATLLSITPTIEGDAASLVSRLEAHLSDTLLVVGHSDSVPEVITAFDGPRVEIDLHAFDNLFVFSPANGALARLKYRGS